jgi:hypothetical protein
MGIASIANRTVSRRTPLRLLATAMAVALALAVPLTASANDVAEATSTHDYTKNMKPIGYSERIVPTSGPGAGIFNSDLAFWGNRAFQGTYEGFRIIDISQPDNPVEINNFTGCVEGTANGSQGDVVVWGDILVRSWDAPRAESENRMCGGIETPAGQEGSHVFDISDPLNPVAVAFVATPCGSHTITGVPDLENNRLLIYSNSSSGGACSGIDILEVPLNDPASASYLTFVWSGDPVPDQPNLVTIDEPSSAAGEYLAAGASFGPHPPEEGISGDIELVNDGSANPTHGCDPLVGFPAGAIALADRGTCAFVIKAQRAQAAGAIALIVANNAPGPPFNMGGDDHEQTIPSVMVSQDDGNTIKAGLPATGTVSSFEMPDNPARACHDTGVILGSVMNAACAGHDGITLWSIGGSDGGSLTEPEVLWSRTFEGVTIGHSAAHTWDGKYVVFGHEPGGGGQARCQETSAEIDKTLFFLDASNGDTVGTLLMPRPQTATENCTWHNYNVVPLRKQGGKARYVLVSGNYQSGISVVDFSNPANPQEIAHADPAPLSETTLIGGGDWSSYWYNGRIYESDMLRGLIIWHLNDKAVAGALKLPHLNPQTQELSLP